MLKQPLHCFLPKNVSSSPSAAIVLLTVTASTETYKQRPISSGFTAPIAPTDVRTAPAAFSDDYSAVTDTNSAASAAAATDFDATEVSF